MKRRSLRVATWWLLVCVLIVLTVLVMSWPQPIDPIWDPVSIDYVSDPVSID